MFYYNKTDITSTVLDHGNEIILANWPNDKHIICTINNDIPIEIPSHPYILVNRSVLCNCGIEVENNFLLESLAMCHDANTNLVMYFMVNTAFTNYIDQFNLTKEIRVSYFKLTKLLWNLPYQYFLTKASLMILYYLLLKHLRII